MNDLKERCIVNTKMKNIFRTRKKRKHRNIIMKNQNVMDIGMARNIIMKIQNVMDLGVECSTNWASAMISSTIAL